MNWIEYFFNLTECIALKSKDRSVKIGAIIVGPDHEIRSTGFNGFPRGVLDDVEPRHERPAKYLYTEHAERNAIFHAARCGVCTKGTTLYLNTGYPCADYARAIIQAGISRVMMMEDKMDAGRWGESCAVAKIMLWEAGVACVTFGHKKEGGVAWRKSATVMGRCLGRRS